jgi:hypothetical protein
MFRYALVLIGAMGIFAAAAAFQDAPAGTPAADAIPAQNQTVIAKNQAFPVLDTQPWVQCNTEDCSDVPNE